MTVSRILFYTRLPQDHRVYGAKLAFSVHLGYMDEAGRYRPLNHNSGLLFAKAIDNRDETQVAKCLARPCGFRLRDGGFGIVAIRTGEQGEDDPDSAGKFLFYRSEDLLQYGEPILVDLKRGRSLRDISCAFDQENDAYAVSWIEDSGSQFRALLREPEAEIGEACSLEPEGFEEPRAEGDFSAIEGVVARNALDVPLEILDRLKRRLTPPVNTGVILPHAVSFKDLAAVKAVSTYSDGSMVERGVDWRLEGVDSSKPGSYRVSGSLRQPRFSFPFATDRADPCVGKWKGKYYFIATNDADKNHTLFIRESADFAGLVAARETLILDSSTYPEIGNLLWAPEFHIIGDDLYIFHAATPEPFFHEESHVMKLRAGGDPMRKEDWERPRRVTRSDGSEICEAGKAITLDMTCLQWEGAIYAVWAQRRFLPVDQGSWLYIARLDSSEPWRLAGEPVLLNKPDYSWENNHTFVVEGPFALYRGDRLFLSYSGAAVDSTYAVGLMSIRRGADILDPKAWVKQNFPLLTSRSVDGEFGPGHNSYVTDDDGLTWTAYHARPGLEAPRSSGFRRVHFGAEGWPVLDLAQEADIKPEFGHVSMELTVE